jgi:tetratricopeptide (TPR) repeat protein
MLVALLAFALAAPQPASRLLAEARQHARDGDWVAMRADADAALDLPGDHQRQAQLLIGVSYELGGEPDKALAMYDLLLSAYRRDEIPDTLMLRRATALGRLERYGPARRQLRRLERRGITPEQQVEVGVLRGLWDLADGRDERGLSTLRDALALPAPSPYWRSQGHARLVAYALEQCDRFPLTGDPDEIEAALDTRARLVDLAMDQATRLARLDHPRVTLDALSRLARSFEVIGADLLEHGDYLDEAERIRRVEGVWLKAIGFVDRGLLVASRDLHDPTAVADLEARRVALQERIEGL